MSEELNLGDYKTFDRVDTPFGEQVKAENTETGVSRLITHDELLRAHGHDPNQQQPAAEAVHHAEAHDIPVTVIGSYGLGDDKREYLKIEGSDTGIPRDELEFASQEESDSPEELTEFSEYDLSSKALDIKEQLAIAVDKERARRRRLQDDEPIDSYESMLRRYLVNEATIGGKELLDEDKQDLWLLSQRSEKKLQRVIESYLPAETEPTAAEEDIQPETADATHDEEDFFTAQSEHNPTESSEEHHAASSSVAEADQPLSEESETQDLFEPGQEGSYFSPLRGFEKAKIQGFVEKDGKKYVQLSHNENGKEEIEEVELGIYDAWQDEALASGAYEVTAEDTMDISSRRGRIWTKIQNSWKHENNKGRKRKAKFVLGALAATNLIGQVGIVAYVFKNEWKRRHPKEEEKTDEGEEVAKET